MQEWSKLSVGQPGVTWPDYDHQKSCDILALTWDMQHLLHLIPPTATGWGQVADSDVVHFAGMWHVIASASLLRGLMLCCYASRFGAAIAGGCSGSMCASRWQRRMAAWAILPSECRVPITIRRTVSWRWPTREDVDCCEFPAMLVSASGWGSRRAGWACWYLAAARCPAHCFSLHSFTSFISYHWRTRVHDVLVVCAG